MAGEDNIERLRRGHEAFSTQDMGTLAEIIAEDSVWHVTGKSPVSGEYRGREEIFGFFQKLGELTQGTGRLEVHDYTSSGDHVIALTTFSASRNGRDIRSNICEVGHWQNGQIAESWLIFEDPYAVDAFYAD